MLYPFTITFDAHIQASSYQEAQEIAASIAENSTIESECTELNTDLLEVSDFSVLDTM